MSDDPNDANTSDPDVHSDFYKLPPANTFDEVNRNFDSVSGMFVATAAEMKEHARISDSNMVRLAEEVQESLSKVSDDIKSILSSQTMMLTIGVISVGFVTVTLKTFFEAGKELIKLVIP